MIDIKKLAWISLLLAPVVLLADYLVGMWRLEEYRFFPILILSVLFLVSQQWNRRLLFPSMLGWIMIMVSLILIGLAGIYWSPWLGMVAWVIGIGAWFVSHHSNVGSLVPIWIVTWLLIRLPMNLDMQLTAYLQRVTAKLGSFSLDLVDIPHFLSGNIFELEHGPLFVEEACSGVQSLFAILFMATFLVAWLKRSAVTLPIYWLAGIGWAVLMNVFRIVMIAVAQEWWGLNWATGWKHATLGYCCLGLALLLLLSTDRLLRVLFFQLPDPTSTEKANPVKQMWNWLFTAEAIDHEPRIEKLGQIGIAAKAPLLIAVIALFLVVGQLVARPSNEQSQQTQLEPIWKPSETLLQSSGLQAEIISFESVRKSTDDTLGMNADIWNIMSGGVPARVAISQPYPEFHELTVCYSAVGWRMNDRLVMQGDDDWGYVRASYLDNQRGSGLLLFCGMDRNGNIVQPIDASLTGVLGARWGYLGGAPTGSDVIMIQLWHSGPSELTADKVNELTRVFLKSRQTIQQSLINN